jgi:hypothetical protein
MFIITENIFGGLKWLMNLRASIAERGLLEGLIASIVQPKNTLP